MYKNTENDWNKWFGGGGVQVLLSYYAKCHETPFCMNKRLIKKEKVGRGEKDDL